MPEETKPKGKRIAADDYWALQELGKALDKKRKEYQKWLRKQARKEDCYIDQMKNVLAGKIVMDPTKEFPEGEIRRASNAFIEKSEIRFDELQVLVDGYNEKCTEVARAYGTTMDLLDPKTGMIRPDDSEAAEKPEKEPIVEVIGETETGLPEKPKKKDKPKKE